MLTSLPNITRKSAREAILSDYIAKHLYELVSEWWRGKVFDLTWNYRRTLLLFVFVR